MSATPSTAASTPSSQSGSRIGRATRVIVVSSVAFHFISHWRTAAVVLCDMSSTVYYIGEIVESAIGKAAPWFIFAVLLFSYGMRAVYIESSALFVRGGVYKVVKEAMGGFLAKLSVSALLFDYVLTGPISGVSAGQYIVGLMLEVLSRYAGLHLSEDAKAAISNWGSVVIACGITLYFFRENLRGIPESSDKALKIMIATTVMAVIMLGWCGVTLAMKGTRNDLPTWKPDLHKKVEIDAEGKPVLDENGNPKPKINELTGKQEDPLGFISRAPSVAEPLRNPTSWLSIIGVLGLVIAFGHSVLAMSGEETLAQVYREVESPKLPNFKKAAFTVFLYSFLLTGTMSLLSVLLIPEGERLGVYKDNWMGGLAMQMVGPVSMRLMLNAFVVVVGFLILAGAVNTSIIGSNGVLSRVAEDGVLPDWFLKPHSKFGTSSRILWLITIMQLFTIVISRGDVLLLGEAYAFGVIWSFVFKTLSMVILRFKDRTPREFKVPGNIMIGGTEIPLGLGFIFLIMFLSAIANLLTKEVATISGLIFTAAFLTVFMVTEHLHEKKRRGAKHEHLEQFNKEVAHQLDPKELGLSKPHRKLIAIRSTFNLFMLEKGLAETDPDTTDIVVMTAKMLPKGGEVGINTSELDVYDQHLMTAVVEKAERAGKKVIPLIVPTNNPLHAVLTTAKDIQANEVIIGASNKFTAEVQLEQVAFYWISMHGGKPVPMTVRILGRDRDVYYDIDGGSRIPKIGDKARSVEELRASGVGVKRMLFVHDGTHACTDLFQSVVTMLDEEVVLDIAATLSASKSQVRKAIERDEERAKRIGREMQVHYVSGEVGSDIVRFALEGQYEVIVLPIPDDRPDGLHWPEWIGHVLNNAHCRVFMAANPVLPKVMAQ